MVNFAQLTQRAGNFLVAREPIDNFSWDMVKTPPFSAAAGPAGRPKHDVTFEEHQGDFTSGQAKSLRFGGFKYDEKIISASQH